MTILANISNLSLRLGHRQIFDNASLTIQSGEKIGVLGLNGHGKSTLFKVLIGEMSPDITQPAFIYDKNNELSFFHVPQELDMTHGERIADEFFYTFYPKLDLLRVEIDRTNEELNENYEDESLLNKQQSLYEKWEHSQVDRIHAQFTSHLKNLGFEQFDLPLNKMSGGERRKVALALGLSSNASLILWDEPTNHLDLKTIAIFEEELQKSSKTFLLISHDRELLAQVSTRIIHINHQKIESFQGSYQEYLDFLKVQQEHRLKAQDKIQNRLRRETAWIRQGVKARGTKSKKRVQGYHELNDNLQKLKNLQTRTMTLSIEQDKVKTKQLAEAIDLSIEFPGKRILNPTSFIIANKSKIALLGDNGTGKSTLVRALQDDIDFKGIIKKKDGILITYFSQHLELPKDTVTPYEYIGEGSETLSLPSGRTIHIYSYLDDFLFSSEEANRPMSNFSGGEKKRLQLAKFFLQPSELMIFDEPSNDLDLESIGILEEELTKFKGPIIIITHDRELIRNVTNTCWHLQDQQLDFFTAGFEQWEQTQEIREIEAKLKATQPETSKPANAPAKLSNKEKMRIKSLPKEIETIEMQVLELEEKIEGYDYEISGYEEITSLNKSLETANKKLQSLYEEKEGFDKESR